jgi:hypothetical protein
VRIIGENANDFHGGLDLGIGRVHDAEQRLRAMWFQFKSFRLLPRIPNEDVGEKDRITRHLIGP